MQNERWSTVGIAVAPLGVMVVATLLFEASGFRLPELSTKIGVYFPSAGEIGLVEIMAESRARLFWLTLVLLFYFASISLGVIAWGTLRRCLAQKALKKFLLIGTLAFAVYLGYFALSAWLGAPVSAIYTFTSDSLERAARLGAAELLRVRALVSGLNLIAAAAPVLALLAVCSTVSWRRNDGGSMLRHVERQMSNLKTMMNLSAAVMAIGVLHMLVWLSWPATLVNDADVANEIRSLAGAVSVYWGATYSLFIVGFYVPSSVRLWHRAKLAIAAAPEEADGLDARDWLKRHGLSLSPAGQVRQVVTMLAPLLAGPIGSTLAGLAGAVG